MKSLLRMAWIGGIGAAFVGAACSRNEKPIAQPIGHVAVGFNDPEMAKKAALLAFDIQLPNGFAIHLSNGTGYQGWRVVGWDAVSTCDPQDTRFRTLTAGGQTYVASHQEIRERVEAALKEKVGSTENARVHYVRFPYTQRVTRRFAACPDLGQFMQAIYFDYEMSEVEALLPEKIRSLVRKPDAYTLIIPHPQFTIDMRMEFRQDPDGAILLNIWNFG